MLKLKAGVSQRAAAVIDCKAFLDVSAVFFFFHAEVRVSVAWDIPDATRTQPVTSGAFFIRMREDEMSSVRGGRAGLTDVDCEWAGGTISEYDLLLRREKELKLSLNHREIIYHFY